MLTTAERRTTISLSPPSTPRLLMQPPRTPRSPRTLLDGGWWPRSSDPVAELPGLILALNNRHGPITRVMLRAADWDSHPRRLRVNGPGDNNPGVDSPGVDGPATGHVIRLGWFDTLPAGLLTAICADGQRTDLLTVPPHTDAVAARTAMELAAQPDNRIHTPDILSAITAPATQIDQLAAQPQPEDVWESEGGQLTDTTTNATAIDRLRPGPLPVGDRRSP
jgi:hypothetical protein